MRKQHIKLSEKEHSYLTTLTLADELKARKYKRVMTLLLLDEGKMMSEVSKLIKYCYPSVVNLKKKFLAEGLQCLEEKPRAGRPIVFDGEERVRSRLRLVRQRLSDAHIGVCVCWLIRQSNWNWSRVFRTPVCRAS